MWVCEPQSVATAVTRSSALARHGLSTWKIWIPSKPDAAKGASQVSSGVVAATGVSIERKTRSPYTPMSPWNVPQSTSAIGFGLHGFEMSTMRKPPFQVP